MQLIAGPYGEAGLLGRLGGVRGCWASGRRPSIPRGDSGHGVCGVMGGDGWLDPWRTSLVAGGYELCLVAAGVVLWVWYLPLLDIKAMGG